MTELLAGIEQSAFSTWVRESGSVWSYPSILFLHTIGMALLVGLNVAIDLRLLGAAGRLSVAPLKRFFPLMWAGFWINAVSGVVLLASDATAKLLHPAFYIKMGFIAASVAVMIATERRVFGDADIDTRPLPPVARTLALASIVCWAGAITAGRLMTYFAAVPDVVSRLVRIGG